MKPLDFIADYLRHNPGHTIKLLVRGNSMRPYLVHERDSVQLKKNDTVEIGDIVFAEISPSHFVLHRVVEKKDNQLTLRGDGNLTIEKCKVTDVCGTVIAFYRKGSETPTPIASQSYKMYAWIWMHTLPLRRILLRLHHMFFGSCKELNREQQK